MKSTKVNKNILEDKYPTVDFIIPTLNSSSVLENCLKSIRSQKYLQSRLNILILDGGSTDSTLQISQKYKCKIFSNQLITSESGKALGVKHASSEYLAFIDSDNILPDKKWLLNMLYPFYSHPKIIGSEPFELTYRSQAGFIERYCSLLGANDPYAYFYGNYDRLSHINNQWTVIKIDFKEYNKYFLINLHPQQPIPTFGANGTIFRTSFIKKYFKGSYLFDIDLLETVLDLTKSSLYFAKVKTGIIHTYCESSINKFIKKQNRRIRDIYTYKEYRTYKWGKPVTIKNLLFILYSFSVIFPLIDSFRGFRHKPDIAWFFHPLACFLTAFIYGTNSFLYYFGFDVRQSRNQWRQ